MDSRKIAFSPPDIGEEEIRAVSEVLRSGWITTGPKTRQFEKQLAQYCNTNQVVCFNSATAAEELNLRILGIGKGDEVIVPAYTYTATVSAAIHVGATVVFVDSQPGCCEMDYDRMEQAINERTKAIIAVDIGGIICDYDKIFQIVESKRNLFRPSNAIQEAMGRAAVLADCAHALGAKRNGKMAGEIADFSSFSFHAVKNLTTAEGGASTWRSIPNVDDDALFRMFQLYSLHGQSKDALAKTELGAWEYDIIGPWYKCNMTDIMAALGVVQLERYPGLLKRRKELIQRYDAACDRLGILHLDHYGEHHESSGHLYMARVPGMKLEQRNALIAKMAQRGIACNVHYKPLPMMTAYRAMGWKIEDFPNAYDYFQNEITLPLHTKLTNDDVDYVIQNLTELISCY